MNIIPRSLRSAFIPLGLIALTIICAISASVRAAQPSVFPRGSFTLEMTTSAAFNLGPTTEELYGGSVGAGYFILDDLSLNLSLLGKHVIQDGDDADAAGFQVMLRHHFFAIDRWTFFADAGLAAFEANNQVPANGTEFNFLSRFGLGATYRLNDHWHLMFGTRYVHLSNARIDGRERNPSINGVEGYVGLLVFL